MNPYPVSFFNLDGKIYKIYNVAYEKTDKYNDLNGTVIKQDKNEFIIKASDGIIKILDLKKEGKKRMLIHDYLNGEKEDFKGMICNDK